MLSSNQGSRQRMRAEDIYRYYKADIHEHFYFRYLQEIQRTFQNENLDSEESKFVNLLKHFSRSGFDEVVDSYFVYQLKKKLNEKETKEENKESEEETKEENKENEIGEVISLSDAISKIYPKHLNMTRNDVVEISLQTILDEILFDEIPSQLTSDMYDILK